MLVNCTTSTNIMADIRPVSMMFPIPLGHIYSLETCAENVIFHGKKTGKTQETKTKNIRNEIRCKNNGQKTESVPRDVIFGKRTCAS